MQSTIEDVSTVQKRVKIELVADQVTEAFTAAYRELQKKAQVRGFRPGKAPLNMIKQMYGQSVAADVADKLIKKHLFDAIDQNELRPIASPSLEQVQLPKQGESYAFSALIDIMPSLTLSGHTGLTATCTANEITDEDINTELKAVQKSHAKRKPASEETISAPGMIATISHTAQVDGEPFPPLTSEKLEIEMGAGHTLSEIDQALIGMKAGEEKSIDFTLSKDFPNQEMSNKKVDLQLKIDGLQELVLPNLDDEFAKDLGLENLGQLKDNIRQHYESTHERSRRSELETSLMDQIIAKNNFEVPPAMVASVIDDMIDQMQWPTDQEKQKAKGDQDFRGRFVDQAKRRAKNTLVLWELAKAEKIEVSDEDVDRHIVKNFLRGEEPADEKGQQLVAQIKQSMGANLKDNLIFEKSLDFLIDNAKIKEIKKKS